MALVYLVNKPQVLGIIARWLSLFLEYDFTIMYKPNIIHVFENTLSRLPNIIKLTSVFDETTYAYLFYIELEWLKVVKEFFRIEQIESILSIQ
jgi:hypothetical protein